MTRHVALALAALLSISCAGRTPLRTASPLPTADAPAEPVRPFGDTYPLEVTAPFHAGLVHWLDSLADMSGAGVTSGKTAALHRSEYLERFGRLDPGDVEAITRFVEARRGYVLEFRRENVNGLSRVMFDAPDTPTALRAAEALAGGPAAEDIESAMLHFEERYREIWRDGEPSRRFVAELLSHSLRRELGDLLARLTAFYGVDPADPVAPTMVVVPTPDGGGTHAQALDNILLLEVRPRDGMLDQVGAIVHENAHFLFSRVDGKRLAAWERLATDRGRDGVTAWFLLIEALPTALGQGVAERMFTGGAWSPRRPWYPRAEVDRYAKALVPLVGRSLADGRPLDDMLIAEMLDLWTRRTR